jgi:enoyl-CoA hydratase
MDFQNLLVEVKDRILYVRINRPKSLNALNRQTFAELEEVFTSHTESRDIVGAIITGEGEKSFVAGADIAEFADFRPEEGTKLSANGQRIMNIIESWNKPVIAVINGFALGGGCELAMCCHVRIAEEPARFGQPEVNLGIIPGYAGTQRLAELVGKGKAMELLITGDMIGAEEAHRIGLVNHVTPVGEGIAKAEEILAKVGKKGPIAVAGCITLVNMKYRTGDKPGSGYTAESEMFGEMMNTADFKEGTQAFLEKRKAEFKGE